MHGDLGMVMKGDVILAIDGKPVTRVADLVALIDPRTVGPETITALRDIPVVILSTSRHEDDVAACYDLHANSYVVKATSLKRYFEIARIIERFWLSPDGRTLFGLQEFEDPEVLVGPWVMTPRVLRLSDNPDAGLLPERGHCEVYELDDITTQIRH